MNTGPLRVLVAITEGAIGGAQQYALVEIEHLLASGDEVHLAVPTPSPMAARAEELGAIVHTWKSIRRAPNPRQDFAARRELGRICRAVHPDVLNLHSAKAGLLGRRVLRPPAGVTVFTCHHPVYGPKRIWWHRLIGRPLEQLTLPMLDAVISDGVRDIALLRRLARGVPVHYIRNTMPSRADPRSPETPVKHAVFVARMAHPKDPLLAVHSWKHVAVRHPDARLTLVGSGPLLDEVRAAAAASPVADLIDVPGFVDDIGAVHASASIFVLTTRVEGGNTMATLEAMSDGLVPVVSDAGDAFCYELARCGRVLPDDPEGVAAVIADLFDQPQELAAMRGRAIDWVSAFSPADQAVAIRGVFAAALDKARGGEPGP